MSNLPNLNQSPKFTLDTQNDDLDGVDMVATIATKRPYQKVKIAVLFTLVGSVLGAVIMTVGFFGYVGLTISVSGLDYIMIMIGFIISLIFSTLPASITGLVISLTQMTIENKKDYLKLALIGGAISLVIESVLLQALLTGGGDELHDLYIPSIFVGMITAVVTGWLVLPKNN